MTAPKIFEGWTLTKANANLDALWAAVTGGGIPLPPNVLAPATAVNIRAATPSTLAGTAASGAFVAVGYGQRAEFDGFAASGNPAAPAATLGGSILCSIAGGGFDGTTWHSLLASIEFTASDNYTPTKLGTGINWWCTAVGGTTRVLAMSIGDLAVRSLVPFDVQGPPAATGAGRVQIGGHTRTTIGANGAATALTANPLGYLDINVAGVAAQIPYYNRGA